MATTNKVKGWIGVLMTEDSSSHRPTKRKYVYSETSRRAGLEFVCIFGHDGVGPAHVPYQLTYFGSDAWSSGPTPSALPSPISSEPTTVPADDRLRFHDDEDALPILCQNSDLLK